VRYRNVWPLLDLEFFIRNGRLEYDLMAHPGARTKRPCSAGRAPTEVRAPGRLLQRSEESR
jgi:hypothetical protein